MSFPRVSMRKLREILRLHFEAGLKHRQIARNCNTSHVTVDKNVDAATQAALSWPLPEDLADDEALYTRLFPTSVAAAEPPRLLPEWADIHDQLSAKGMTLQLLWEEYRRDSGRLWLYAILRLLPPLEADRRSGPCASAR